MGGTIARLTGAGEDVVVAILTGHGDEPHPLWPPEHFEPIRAECRIAAEVMGVKTLVFRELPALCLANGPVWEANGVVDELIREYQPSDVYHPFAFDLHKDHGAIAYAVSVVARSYLESAKSIRRVLAYETLSETHLAPPYLAPAFQPNVFINITDTLETKLDAMRAYASQLQPDHLPRSIASLRALATLHGGRIGVPAAEAFLLIGEYQR